MLYILHGDDTLSSKNKLTSLTTEFKNLTTLDCEKVKVTDLLQAFSSNDLFLDTKCIVLEKILKLKKPEMDKLMELLSTLPSTTTVVLWHNTELSKIALGKFKNGKVESFVLPKLFFSFLDELSPRTLQKELHTLSLMQKVEAEQVFYAMVKRIRQLIMIKSGGNFEELVKMNPWQLGKLKTQSASWSVEKLESLYKQLFVLEVKMKSGGLVLPLRQHLDIVLIQELN